MGRPAREILLARRARRAKRASGLDMPQGTCPGFWRAPELARPGFGCACDFGAHRVLAVPQARGRRRCPCEHRRLGAQGRSVRFWLAQRACFLVWLRSSSLRIISHLCCSHSDSSAGRLSLGAKSSSTKHSSFSPRSCEVQTASEPACEGRLSWVAPALQPPRPAPPAPPPPALQPPRPASPPALLVLILLGLTVILACRSRFQLAGLANSSSF